MTQLVTLNPGDSNQPFPDVSSALTNPDGLLAVGGCLSSRRIHNAYYNGIFPWYSDGEPILWWSPDPRLVLYPNQFKLSRSLRKTINRGEFQITYNQAFAEVIAACAKPRENSKGIWLTQEMQQAYCKLHTLGVAHSVEAWHQGHLAGGLYGIGIGQVFYGESMFSLRSNASKVAFATLIECFKNWCYTIIDCQVYSNHLVSLGAENIPRQQFIQLLKEYRDQPVSKQAWQLPS